MFECRAASSEVKDDKTKIQWCESVIENIGRRILAGLPEGAQWRHAKEELRKYLGEDDPKTAAWKRLRGYKAKGKCFGEIASEVKELIKKAADEEDVWARLAVETFLRVIPRHVAREIRVKCIESLKEALKEAKLRKSFEDEEDSKKRVQAVTEDLRTAKQEARNKTKENRRGRRGPVCLGCGEEGHVLKNGELWKEFEKEKHKTKEVEVKPELNLNRDRSNTHVQCDLSGSGGGRSKSQDSY